MAWSVRRDPPLSGPVNMARDHALALFLEPGRAVLRTYRWSSPTLSLGRNEPARDLYDREKAVSQGVSFVRRPTGGRGVLHNRELTYSVVVPLGALGGLRETYRRINEALCRGLASLGVPAEIAGEEEGRTLPPDGGPCFQIPAPGEVVAEGRKLVGSAQVRLGNVVLQHGSILLADDQGMVARLRGEPPGPAPATLGDFLRRVPPHRRLAASLETAFRETIEGSWDRPDDGPVRGEEDLVERYESEDWTWNR